MEKFTRQGVRNLDAIKAKRIVGRDFPPCDGKTNCTPSKWAPEGAGTKEVRRCLCCHRVMARRDECGNLLHHDA